MAGNEKSREGLAELKAEGEKIDRQIEAVERARAEIRQPNQSFSWHACSAY